MLLFRWRQAIHSVNSACNCSLMMHFLHAQAVSDSEFETMKKELHGAGVSTLRFAESAEQQHMEVDHSPHDLPSPAVNDALATRLAPLQGPSSFIQPAPVRPTQVSVPRASWIFTSVVCHTSLLCTLCFHCYLTQPSWTHSSTFACISNIPVGRLDLGGLQEAHCSRSCGAWPIQQHAACSCSQEPPVIASSPP